MVEQLTITTPDKVMLKPLVASAIEREKKMLALNIKHTQAKLGKFERKFDMASGESEYNLNTLKIAETVEFTDWRMEIATLRLLKSHYRALGEAQLD